MKFNRNWIRNLKRTLKPLVKEYRLKLEPLYKKYVQMQIWVRAEALSFHTILAVIPILGFTFWFLTRMGVTGEWIEEIKDYILSHLSVVSNEALDEAVESILGMLRNQNMGVIATLFLIYSSFKLITKFGAAQDTILNVKLADDVPIRLSFVRLTLRRAFLMMSLPIVLITSIFASNWIKNESWIRGVFDFEHVGPFFALPLAWGVGVFAFAILYYFVPQKRVRWWSAVKAATVVVPCLEITRFLLVGLNQYAVTTHKIYGAFAVVPFTFFWIQIAWVIILAGGLFLRIKRKPRAV